MAKLTDHSAGFRSPTQSGISDDISRRDALVLLGTSVAAALCASCLAGCQDDTPTGLSDRVDFSVDLSSPAGAALAATGGSYYRDGVIVAHVTADSYVAFSQACTHLATTVQFTGTQFVCPAHGSVYRLDGTVAQGPAPTALRRFNTSLSGAILRVYS